MMNSEGQQDLFEINTIQMTLRLKMCAFHCFSLSLNKAGTSYMLREYSSKERKVEDLLEFKVCILLGFCSGLPSPIKEE